MAALDELPLLYGIALAILPAFSGNYVWLAFIGMEHVLFVTFSLTAILLWFRPGARDGDARGPDTRRVVLAGLALGALGMTRPEGLALSVLLFALFKWCGRTIGRCLQSSGGCGAVSCAVLPREHEDLGRASADDCAGPAVPVQQHRQAARGPFYGARLDHGDLCQGRPAQLLSHNARLGVAWSSPRFLRLLRAAASLPFPHGRAGALGDSALRKLLLHAPRDRAWRTLSAVRSCALSRADGDCDLSSAWAACAVCQTKPARVAAAGADCGSGWHRRADRA